MNATTTIMPATNRTHVLAKPMVSPQSENLLPSIEWDADQLAEYVRERLSYAELFGRKTALQLWLAGRALLLVKTILKAERRWTSWAKKNGIGLTAAYNCMRIAETFPDEDAIHGLTTVEVKQIAGIARVASPESKKPSVDLSPVVTSNEPRNGEMTLATPESYIPTLSVDQDQQLDIENVLDDLLTVVENLSGSLDKIDPSSVHTSKIETIITHLGRLTAHAVSL